MRKLTTEYYSADSVSYMLDMGGLIEERAIDALALLPQSIVDFAVENCTILTIKPDEDGVHWNLNAKIFKDKKSLIILNPNLWEMEWPKVVLVIAHEIAHAYLGHTIWMCSDKDPKHEKAADTLAVKWLAGHWKKEELTKFCAYLGRKFE